MDEQDLMDPTYGCATDVSQRAQRQALLLNQFQARWRYEYLTSLREHHRTTGNNSQRVKPGDVVLVYDDSPRNTWKLAIVEELMTGKDGLVRAVKIKTAQGRTNRPIAKLIPLEVSTPIVPETDRSSSAAHQETTVGDTVERPHRAAALRGRERVKNWVEQLGGPPEDVMD